MKIDETSKSKSVIYIDDTPWVMGIKRQKEDDEECEKEEIEQSSEEEVEDDSEDDAKPVSIGIASRFPPRPFLEARDFLHIGILKGSQ